jgi:uncharacterized membrane protein YGL010W
MNATMPMRPIDRYFHSYSDDHRNTLNQRIHVVAVPAILWSVVALLWCIPVPGTLMHTGIWAALAMFFAWMFYYRMSRTLGWACWRCSSSAAACAGWSRCDSAWPPCWAPP